MSEKDFVKEAKKTYKRLTPKLRVEKEAFILKELNKNTFRTFEVPRLIKATNKQIVMQKVEPDSTPTKEEVYGVIREFEKIKIRFPLKLRLFNVIFDSSEMRIIYMATKFRRKIGWKKYFKTLKLLCSLRKSQKKLKKRFIHNDHLFRDVLKENNQLYLIDLESAVYRRRWVLKDILYLSQREDGSFDLDWIKKYVADEKEINVKSQIRLFLLEQLFTWHIFASDKLEVNLLNDDYFNKYYKENINL